MIRMHKRTWKYLYDNLHSHRLKGQVQISHQRTEDCKVYGHNIKIDNSLRPTSKPGSHLIPGELDSPKEPFVTYEESDREWLEYFNIGTKATHLTEGDMEIDEQKVSVIEKKKPRRNFHYDPTDPTFKKQLGK